MFMRRSIMIVVQTYHDAFSFIIMQVNPMNHSKTQHGLKTKTWKFALFTGLSFVNLRQSPCYTLPLPWPVRNLVLALGLVLICKVFSFYSFVCHLKFRKVHIILTYLFPCTKTLFNSQLFVCSKSKAFLPI